MTPGRVDDPSDDPDLLRPVERFLAWEATLLDDERFDDWLGTLTEDVCYRVATRPVVEGPAGEPDRPPLWYLDEDRTSLTQRVARMADGTAWAEVPPSRTQRLVTGILVQAGAEPATVLARSAFLLHRVRLEREIETFAGTRHDVLRCEGGALRLAARDVVLAANALPGKSLSLFF